MKALGSLVTFVRRSLSGVVTFKDTSFDIKVWSRMFAVNVQSISIQQVIWSLISWYTRTLKVLVAFYVIKVSSINKALLSTFTDVLLSWMLLICYQYVSNHPHNTSSVVCYFFFFFFCYHGRIQVGRFRTRISGFWDWGKFEVIF